MEKTKRLSGIVVALLAMVVLAGCSGDSMSKSEIDGIKNSPEMTEADRAKVAQGMADGGAKAKQSEAEWAAANPEEAAKINAERAAMGRPPLGGK